MLVIFLQIDKESKSKKIFFFYWGGGGGGGGGGRGRGGRVNIIYKCFKWHFYSSRNTNEMYQINLKYMLKYRRNSPDRFNL